MPHPVLVLSPSPSPVDTHFHALSPTPSLYNSHKATALPASSPNPQVANLLPPLPSNTAKANSPQPFRQQRKHPTLQRNHHHTAATDFLTGISFNHADEWDASLPPRSKRLQHATSPYNLVKTLDQYQQHSHRAWWGTDRNERYAVARRFLTSIRLADDEIPTPKRSSESDTDSSDIFSPSYSNSISRYPSATPPGQQLYAPSTPYSDVVILGYPTALGSRENSGELPDNSNFASTYVNAQHSTSPHLYYHPHYRIPPHGQSDDNKFDATDDNVVTLYLLVTASAEVGVDIHVGEYVVDQWIPHKQATALSLLLSAQAARSINNDFDGSGAQETNALNADIVKHTHNAQEHVDDSQNIGSVVEVHDADPDPAAALRSTENDYLYDSDSRAHGVDGEETVSSDDADSQSRNRHSQVHDRPLHDDDDDPLDTQSADDRLSTYNYRSHQSLPPPPALPPSILLPTILRAARRQRRKLRQRQQLQQLGINASRFMQLSDDDSDEKNESTKRFKREQETLVTTRNPNTHDRDVYERRLVEQGAAYSRVYVTHQTGSDADTKASPFIPLISTSYLSYVHEQHQRNALKASANAVTTTDSLSETGSIRRSDTLRHKLLRQGRSYAHLLQPQTTGANSSLNTDDTDDQPETYNPFFLDDPNIKSGRHRVVLNLPGYISSIISYTRHSELKDELNERFRARHEWIDPTMSLSKIRKLKRLMLHIGQELDLELSTVALAYIYFERLCVRNVVNKANRRVMAGCSLLLAFKYNEHQPRLRDSVRNPMRSRGANSLTISSQNSVSSIEPYSDTDETSEYLR